LKDGITNYYYVIFLAVYLRPSTTQ